MTRAQEAEENYLIKRELATIKQQTDAARAKLEQAESTIRELRHHRHWVRSLLELVLPPCRSRRESTAPGEPLGTPVRSVIQRGHTMTTKIPVLFLSVVLLEIDNIFFCVIL